MNRRILFALIFTAAAGTTGGPQAVGGEYEDFLARYAPYHQKATAHLWRNIKATGERIRYDESDVKAPPLAKDKFSAVADGSKLVYMIVETGVGQQPGKTYKRGGFVSDDTSFDTDNSNDSLGKIVYKVFFPWDAASHDSYFSSYQGLYLPLNFPLYRLYVGHGPNCYYRPNPIKDGSSTILMHGSTFTVRNEPRKGVDCIVVRQESPNRDRPLDDVYYLDPKTYLVLARERTGMPQARTRQIEPIRRVVEISYGAPAADTGLPFPTAIKTTYHMPDGKTLPGESVTFTEYRRYTPTPDEVDVEKVLKVKMPTIPPRPPLPPEGQYLDPDRPGELLPAVRRSGRTAWPWYAGGGVLAVASVTLGLLFRRRRRAVP